MRTETAFASAVPLIISGRTSQLNFCPSRKRIPCEVPSVRAQLVGDDRRNHSTNGSSVAAKRPVVPWQLVSTPVYTVCTYSSELGRGNMNLLTYMSPCGLGTKPKFSVALYVGTLTWVTVKQMRRLRVAFLTENHAPLFALLGKQSGRDVDKVTEARSLGYDIAMTSDKVPYPRDSLGYVDLTVDNWIDAGDHEIAICSTVSHETFQHDDKQIAAALTTGHLRENGYC